MKLSEKWIREWVNPPLSRDALSHQLTMVGLSVESCEPVGNDFVFEFELTPNRGDCLSVLGVAREISVLTQTAYKFPSTTIQNYTQKNPIDVSVEAAKHCPKYTGRVIKNFSPHLTTPHFVREMLEKSGIKIIHPIVDIMNFVMLEYGQPLHAFDLNKINKNIIVRMAKKNEEILLLDGKKIQLQKDTLVIADDSKLLAVAGIMGGLDSAVDENTTAIFIESAFFTPEAIAGRARRYGLTTDASHRFERGVDPELPRIALERATELLLSLDKNIEVFEVIEKTNPKFLPKPAKIKLSISAVEKTLGISLGQEKIKKILQDLGFSIESQNKKNLTASSPRYRFDIAQEVDLIEEIARIYGYDNIPAQENILPLKIKSLPESRIPLENIKKKLVYQGYQEVITYSFISEKLHKLFSPDVTPISLANPLSAELAVMRANLWPGLIQVVLYNLARQQAHCRLFEEGLRLVGDKQEPVLSGVWAGSAFEEQWGESKRMLDFYDVKKDLERLGEFEWVSGNHPALHPAQTAELRQKGKTVGWCGALHPQLQQSLEIKVPVYLFEISLEALSAEALPSYQAFSKFPAVRRDIALLVDESVTAQTLEEAIREQAGLYLQDVFIFDVYQGKNIAQGKKSVALGLIFQANEKTLLEEDIQAMMQRITGNLTQKTGAQLRE